jgi:CheY-like chemotaxis protein
MPELDGYQMLERIRTLEPDQRGLVPVIAVTAFQRLEDYSKALEQGFDFFLVKPVNPDELIRATDRTCDGGPLLKGLKSRAMAQ